MIGLLLCLLAFSGSIVLGRQSLGRGVAWLLTVGYFYGILRANVLDSVAHFTFDAALAGLFAAALTRGAHRSKRARDVVAWVTILSIWPALLLLVPVNHPFIQLIGLRAAVWFLPMTIVGAAFTDRDMGTVARVIVVLNLAAFGFAIAEFILGIERFFPRSPVTELIYLSKDIAGHTSYRIPSIFSTSSHYGGAMVASVPLLALNMISPEAGDRWRIATVLSVCASAIGIFMCGARTPFIYLVVCVVVVVVWHRPPVKQAAIVLVIALVVAFAAAQDERLQRFETLGDVDEVRHRVTAGGGNPAATLAKLAWEHPVGVGLGGGSGTSYPSFLKSYAPKAVGAENEYVRIAVEQGIPGLILWCAFAFWILRHVPRVGDRRALLVYRSIYAYVFVSWSTAFLGTGLLMSIPITILLMLYMGRLATMGSPRARAPVAPA